MASGVRRSLGPADAPCERLPSFAIRRHLCCTFQVDAGLSFSKKDLEHSYIFDIKTIDRIFYLVADSEEEMNKWVRCICDICGFNPTDEGKDQQQSAHISRSPHS